MIDMTQYGECTMKNARIISTQLGFEEHGIATFSLVLDYGNGSQQSVGGYPLGPDTHELIFEILRVTGKDTWEDLPGKFIRVVGRRDKVEAIGHITDDKWLEFYKWMEAARVKK